MAVSPPLEQNTVKVADRAGSLLRRSRRFDFVALFFVVAVMLLLLTIQLALVLGLGQRVDQGWVDLDSVGGFLVGGVQGAIQYRVLRSRHRVSWIWVGMTALGWAIVTGYDWATVGVSPAFAQGLGSPILLGVVGLVQCCLLLSQRRLRTVWMQVVGWQVLWGILVQLVMAILCFVLAVLAIATLGREGLLLGGLHSVVMGVYHCGLLAHGVIPAVGLYRLCCDE